MALPADLGSPQELLDGLVASAAVPRLRGGPLGEAVTIAFDTVSGASGTLTLVIARHELAGFASRVLHAVRSKSAGSAKRETSVEIQYGDDEQKPVIKKLTISATDPDDASLRALIEVLEAARPSQQALSSGK